MSLKCQRFLENSLFLDIPIKFLLLAKFHCLTRFALKIILKNVQRIDVTPEYVQKVIDGQVGRESMELACRVAIDTYSNKDISYLDDPQLQEKTDICFLNETTTFCDEIKLYSKKSFSENKNNHMKDKHEEIYFQ